MNETLERAQANTAPMATDAVAGLLQNEAALAGLTELVGKLEPLLAGRRLNRVVDLLSVIADTVDMSDAYMVEKVAKAYEEGMGAAWAAGNAVRMAGTKVSQMEETPSMMGLLRIARTPEVRRGLAFMLTAAGVIGKQLAHDPIDYTVD